MGLLQQIADELTGRDLTRQVLAKLDSLENRMTEIQTSLSQLATAVEGVSQRSQERIDALQTALEEERRAAAEVAANEAAEDVGQNQVLADAQAATDAALAELGQVSGQLDHFTAQLNAVAADPDAGVPDTPAEPVPDTPAEPVPDTPAVDDAPPEEQPTA